MSGETCSKWRKLNKNGNIVNKALLRQDECILFSVIVPFVKSPIASSSLLSHAYFPPVVYFSGFNVNAWKSGSCLLRDNAIKFGMGNLYKCTRLKAQKNLKCEIVVKQ